MFLFNAATMFAISVFTLVGRGESVAGWLQFAIVVASIVSAWIIYRYRERPNAVNIVS